MRCALSLSWVGACAEGRVVSQSPLRSTSNLQDTAFARARPHPAALLRRVRGRTNERAEAGGD